MNANLTRREFAMCIGTIAATILVGGCKLVEFGERIAANDEHESEEDEDEEPI